jgi:hypothetical protein
LGEYALPHHPPSQRPLDPLSTHALVTNDNDRPEELVSHVSSSPSAILARRVCSTFSDNTGTVLPPSITQDSIMSTTISRPDLRDSGQQLAEAALEDRVLLVTAYWRTNLTLRQLAPLFGGRARTTANPVLKFDYGPRRRCISEVDRR